MLPSLPYPIFISVVYGKCSRAGRFPLWEKLREIAISSEGLPWLVGGDFNTLLEALDREGSDTNRASERREHQKNKAKLGSGWSDLKEGGPGGESGVQVGSARGMGRGARGGSRGGARGGGRAFPTTQNRSGGEGRDNALTTQKALDNIKFTRHFSWKQVNAKHILVQFDDLADYALFLNGPAGSPLWFIDRHPMRVFKWTPDYDLYCETPIAAIWCNLIALPIHLFDKSALFAIGKLFGNPIQIDQATANRSRYSFARICVEIDITSQPPEEFVLNIGGREVTQKVKWDKIPLYCMDCFHVGHSKDRCNAFGRKDKQPHNSFKTSTTRQGNGAMNKQYQQGGQYNKKEWVRKQNENYYNRDTTEGSKGNDVPKQPRYKEDLSDILETDGQGNCTNEALGHEGIWKVQNARGGSPSKHNIGRQPNNSQWHNTGDDRGVQGRKGSLSPSRFKHADEGGSFFGALHSGVDTSNAMSSNRYYKLMENGDFDTDTVEDDGDEGQEVMMTENCEGGSSKLNTEKGCPPKENSQSVVLSNGGSNPRDMDIAVYP